MARSVASGQLDPPAPRTRRHAGGLQRAFWRWHFYAAFLVIPVLLVLASTGLIYLLRFQIEPALHADLMKVDVPLRTDRLPYDDQVSAALAEYPDGRVAAVLEPSAPDRSTDITLSTAPPGTPSGEDDSIREVYVDPYTGKVLGSLDPSKTVSGYTKQLHKDLMAGDVGAYVMELGACWAIVMAITGYYLYWRGRVARARRRAARVAGAALRHRHATVGLFVGVGLIGLVVSGLPWTIWWGAKAQELATSQGSSLWSTDPGGQSSAPTLDASVPHSHNVPWGARDSRVPSSTTTTSRRIGIDAAIAVADERGLHRPMTVIPPADETAGVYSVLGYAFHQPGHEATVHVDQFSGELVSEFGYDQYGALAKVVGQGIALHEGRRFGVVNMVVSGLFCVTVIFLCLAGPVMWWRRRPKGPALGAPRGRLTVKTGPVAAAGLVVLGVTLPVFGASLLAVLLLDQVLVRRVPALRQFFNVV